MATSIYNALFTGSEPVKITNNVTAITTLPVTKATHSNRTILLSLTGGFTSTLPAATGSGALFTFAIGVVSTTGYVIICAPLTDAMAGSINVCLDAGASKGTCFMAAAGNNTITLNGTTKGGVVIGDTLWLQDIKSGFWAVGGSLVGSGSLVTPFSTS